jgi:1,2-phenylacetyl-CoA epoxidase catalytic subunit
MSEINHYKKFVLCKIMWHDVVVIWHLVDHVAIDNWWMMWTSCMSRELY